MVEIKFKKFEPMTRSVATTINDLINRNGKLITETKTFVEIQRLNSIAKVDQWGRVEWRPA
jgi:hypothetical protein